jgi:predicted amidohydrolase YtcJ
MNSSLIRISVATRAALCVAVVGSLAVSCSKSAGSGAPNSAVSAKRVFVGNIRTFDDQSTQVEAVAVDARGVIVLRGTRQVVLARTADSQPEIVTLTADQTMLPGFIEPHMHLPSTISANTGIMFSLAACRPAPYSAGQGDCSATIADALKKLVAHDSHPLRWHVGLNLDPSRQPYDATTPSAQFRERAARYLATDVSATRPVVILDQSGHVAYANIAAFDAVEATYRAAGKAWPPKFVKGGSFALSADTPTASGNTKYSGVVYEQEAFTPFLELGFLSYGADALTLADIDGYIKRKGSGVLETMRQLRAAGITTVVGIADTEAYVRASSDFASLPEATVRVSSLTFPTVAATVYQSRPVLAACDPRTSSTCALPRDLGVTGIKLTSDGSTQGCTAGLASPILYTSTGECAATPNGYLDYTGDAIYAALSSLWKTGLWRFETHANGNGAMKLVLDTYARMQAESPNPHRAVLIHATVGDESVWQSIAALRAGTYAYNGGAPAALDVRVTHLIGHVAYWGTIFNRQLGSAAAENIDPTGWDKQYGVPFTLHSDSTVTQPAPLWLARQAVTRETWSYPELRDDQKQVLGEKHRVSIEDALRAVTLRAAEEKELESWLGSIEVGKVADFVVLSRDPLSAAVIADPTQLSAIQVIDTYLGGEKTPQ